MGHAQPPRRVGWGLVAAIACTASVQTPRTQPEGRLLEAADGDTVIVEGEARVSIVRRRQAMVRVVADEANRFVLVLADWGTMESPDPDGTVNHVWRFTGTDGRWPLDNRWQAPATMLMPDVPGRSVTSALSIETPAGVVAFMGGPQEFAPAANVAAVIHFSGMTGGGREGLSFDAAERDAMSPNFMSSVSSVSMLPPGIGFFGERSTIETGSALQPGTPPSAASGPSSRFVRPPQLIRRVEPQRSDAARAAGAQGFVILEVGIALDGTVSAARVLRSIPLLDEAALAAVRQWRYAPAGPEGRPDPLVTSVVVPFSSRDR